MRQPAPPADCRPARWKSRIRVGKAHLPGLLQAGVQEQGLNHKCYWWRLDLGRCQLGDARDWTWNFLKLRRHFPATELLFGSELRSLGFQPLLHLKGGKPKILDFYFTSKTELERAHQPAESCCWVSHNVSELAGWWSSLSRTCEGRQRMERSRHTSQTCPMQSLVMSPSHATQVHSGQSKEHGWGERRQKTLWFGMRWTKGQVPASSGTTCLCAFQPPFLICYIECENFGFR